mmetsp:Transcript_31192/g.58546  ORF Transcript_31192/g.58546 Transcript_31192/m.58546 type:complete len:255 (+) Transcript_31192:92-856(+)
MEQVARRTCALLNKVCWDNYELVAEDIAAIQVQNSHGLVHVVHALIGKVITEPYFSDLYGELIYLLWDRYQVYPAEGAEQKPRTFGRIVLNTVQNEFESLVMSLDSDAGDRQKYGERLGAEMERRLVRMRGLMRLMGHLYVRQLLAMRILEHVMQELIGAGDNNDNRFKLNRLQCVMELLYVVGPQLDGDERGVPLMDSFAQALADIAAKFPEETPKLRKQMQYEISVLLEARANCWQYEAVPGEESNSESEED